MAAVPLYARKQKKTEAAPTAASATETTPTPAGDPVAPSAAAADPSEVLAKVGDQTITRKDVDEQFTSKLSMMPEDLEKQLRPQEIVDLLSYLSLDRPPEDAKAKRIPGTPR